MIQNALEALIAYENSDDFTVYEGEEKFSLNIAPYDGTPKGWVVEFNVKGESRNATRRHHVGVDGKIIMIYDHTTFPNGQTIHFQGPPREVYLFGGPPEKE